MSLPNMGAPGDPPGSTNTRSYQDRVDRLYQMEDKLQMQEFPEENESITEPDHPCGQRDAP